MRKLSRRQWWSVAVTIAVVALVLVLALIVAGVLVIPPSGTPAPVKIQEVCVVMLEGTNKTGAGWFGPGSFCLTGIANGLPYSSPAGSVVNLPIPIFNYDTVNHTIYSVQVALPFVVHCTEPPLPTLVPYYSFDPEGIDGGLQVYVTLPSTPGAALGVNMTINGLTSSGSPPLPLCHSG